MKAQIKLGPFSFDLPVADSSMPPDPADCWVNIVADIGLEHAPGGDQFMFSFCTVKRIASIVAAGKPLFISKTIVLDIFSWDAVTVEIKAIVEKAEGNTWDELAADLSRYADWEFQDYRE